MAAAGWPGASALIPLLAPLAGRLRRAPTVRPHAGVGPAVTWFDDYFTTELVDADTVAIGEPRYYQQNYSYLLRGHDRALLYDSGPGLRDLTPVVRDLTDLPVTATCSHLHYDHIGNLTRFEAVELLDHPAYRAAMRGDVLVPPARLHLGALERLPPPRVHVDGWYRAGTTVDLGGRRLQVLHLPGHTSDGMALHDADRNQLFVGDFAFPGGIFAFVPTSDLADYEAALRTVLDLIDDATTILVAHTGRVEAATVPVMARADLARLLATVREIRAGTARGRGLFPRRYRVDDRMAVLTDLRRNDRRHPAG